MKLNILFSYAYLRNTPIEKWLPLAEVANILIDSGGYTNYWQSIKEAAGHKRSMKPISMDAYIEFCKRVHGKVWGYIALDLPRNTEVTLKQLAIMADAGLKPLPVFPEGMEWHHLEDMLRVNNYVCIAGAVYSKDEYIIQRYQRAKQIGGDSIRIHGLGFGRYPEIIGSLLYSGDSSTWLNSSKYGMVMTFDAERGFNYQMKRDFKKDRAERFYKFSRWYEKCNVTIEDLMNEKLWGGKLYPPAITTALCCLAYIKMIAYLQKKYDIYYFLAAPSIGNRNPVLLSLACVLKCADQHGWIDFQTYKLYYQNELDRLTAGETNILSLLYEALPRFGEVEWEY